MDTIKYSGQELWPLHCIMQRIQNRKIAFIPSDRRTRSHTHNRANTIVKLNLKMYNIRNLCILHVRIMKQTINAIMNNGKLNLMYVEKMAVLSILA